MKKDKRMYKSEIKQIEKLRNVLKSGTKLNGNTVILGDANREVLSVAVGYLELVINQLNQIESAI
ncbi:MAG: hypothetical protein IPO78_17210 [Saprospiraceae bacterium]|nr:hypothetical protein [Saprospiraceae bacterium]